MIKKIFSMMLLCATVLFVSCKDDDNTIEVGGVSIDPATLSLEVGKTATLNAIVTPENADTELQWSTSSATIASIDEAGVVTAVAVGEATITVTTAKGGKTATCKVTVTAIPDKYFPDANFRAAMKEAIPGLVEANEDINPTSATNKTLIEAALSLDISDKNIASLEGVEYFINLKSLSCAANKLSSLDLSANITLDNLNCNLNSIATLTLPETETLTLIQCADNKLTTLDISKCIKVRELSCFRNELTSLDVSKNMAMVEILCHENQISTLDISMLPALDFSKVSCGKQKDAAGTDRNLTLTLTTAQKALFETASANNANITLIEKVQPITWAAGNLVADGPNGAKIGTSIDGGLFFQFGSLVGWSSAGNPTVALRPNGFNGKEGWAETGKIWQSATGTVPFTVKDSGSADEKAGIGDPCRYYLGGTWRLPTKDEYVALFKDGGYPSGTWKWENASKSATNSTLNLTFPASGLRSDYDGSLSSVGTEGNYWSASPTNASYGYNLLFASSVVLSPSNSGVRAYGFPVRCVQNASN